VLGVEVWVTVDGRGYLPRLLALRLGELVSALVILARPANGLLAEGLAFAALLFIESTVIFDEERFALAAPPIPDNSALTIAEELDAAITSATGIPM
jgi:hypothetical protein